MSGLREWVLQPEKHGAYRLGERQRVCGIPVHTETICRHRNQFDAALVVVPVRGTLWSGAGEHANACLKLARF